MPHAISPVPSLPSSATPSLSALANLLAETQRIARIGGWEWDVATGSQAWSEEMYRIFGHPQHTDQPTLDLLLGRVHPEDMARVRAAIEISLTTEAPFDVHHRIVLPNGGVRQVHQRGELAHPEFGGYKMIGTARDETEDVAREQELRRTNHALLTLSACNRALVAATDAQSLIDRMCHILVGVGRYGAAWMVEHGSAAASATVRGLAATEETKRTRMLRAGNAFLAGGLVQRALDGHMMPGEWSANGTMAVSAEWAAAARSFDLTAVLALPLHDGVGAPAGVLAIGRCGEHDFSVPERELLLELAADLSFGLSVLLLREASTDQLRRLESSMEQTIQALTLTIEKRDPYTAGHQRRVADLAHAIGQRLGLTEDDLHGLRLAATVHDIGKISVPSDILARPGRLTEGEFRIIQEHSRIGFDILKDIELPWPVAEVVLQHHERVDGSGYPGGLKGCDILLGARIIGVADTVEAMASHRPYRPGLGISAATEEIRRNAGKLYDPEVVKACIAALEAGEGLVL